MTGQIQYKHKVLSTLCTVRLSCVHIDFVHERRAIDNWKGSYIWFPLQIASYRSAFEIPNLHKSKRKRNLTHLLTQNHKTVPNSSFTGPLWAPKSVQPLMKDYSHFSSRAFSIFRGREEVFANRSSFVIQTVLAFNRNSPSKPTIHHLTSTCFQTKHKKLKIMEMDFLWFQVLK